MSIKFLRVAILITGIFLIIALNGCNIQSNSNTNESEGCFSNNICISVEFAISNEEKQKGLMFKEKISDNYGMYFLYNESPGLRRFWMKNTLIPLDILWLDKKNRIVYISENTPPCKKDPCPTYGPNISSQNVLEVRGGFTKKYNIKINDYFEIKKLS